MRKTIEQAILLPPPELEPNQIGREAVRSAGVEGRPRCTCELHLLLARYVSVSYGGLLVYGAPRAQLLAVTIPDGVFAKHGALRQRRRDLVLSCRDG